MRAGAFLSSMQSSSKATVLHVITDLDQGGAETVLYRLGSSQSGRIRTIVVSMMDAGFYGPRLERAGVAVHVLDMPRGRLTVRGLFRLWRLIRRERPDIIQTWMYHADLVGGLVAFAAGGRRIYWGIRNSTLDATRSSRVTRWVVQICARLSTIVPDRVVCCSEQAAQLHARIGYAAAKMTVIPNGYDLARFAPRPEAAPAVRTQWGVPDHAVVFGCVARWDPQKDHTTLLRAFAPIADAARPTVCILVGSGMDVHNAALNRLVDELGLRERVRLLGPTDDVPRIMAAFDWHVLSSAYGEAFPNVVAESMACGVPNVVTDVGDAALIVGDCGFVVGCGDIVALSAALRRAAELPDAERRALGTRCRARIAASFAIEKMVGAYEKAWGIGEAAP